MWFPLREILGRARAENFLGGLFVVRFRVEMVSPKIQPPSVKLAIREPEDAKDH